MAKRKVRIVKVALIAGIGYWVYNKYFKKQTSIAAQPVQQSVVAGVRG